MSLELQILTPEDEFLTAVEFNFEELKEQLKSKCELYKGLTFTEENMLEGKKDRAALNKLVNAMETRRKEIKKKCLMPYESFELKIKELVSIVNEPISEIDMQIKTFEESLKALKLKDIIGYWNEKAENLKELLDFDKCFNQKWLNSTFKIDDVKKEIDNLFSKVANDLKIIGDLKTDFVLQVKDKYLQTLDLSQALSENTRLEEQAKRLTEYEDKKAEEQAKTKDVEKHIEQTKQEIKQEVKTETKKNVLSFTLKIFGTLEELQVLKKFIDDNKIKYERI